MKLHQQHEDVLGDPTLLLGGGIGGGGGIAAFRGENPHPNDPDKNVPLFGAMAKGLGTSGADASHWWANQSSDEREGFTRLLKHRVDGGTGDPDPHEDCMGQYDDDMEECRDVGIKLNPRAKRACEATAAVIMSQCLKDMPPEDRRRPQKKF